MHRRLLRAPAALALLVLFGLLPGLAIRPVGPATAAPVPAFVQPATRIETIEAAFNLLMDQFYRQPEPAALLQAAWEGLADALEEAGAREPIPPAPELPAGRSGAWRAFAAAYPSLAALAPPEASQVEVAFVAVAAMTASLQEQHTGFLDPESYAAFSAQLSGAGESIGLGVILAGDLPPWVIAKVAPGGPADRASIRPGDTIVTVNGTDVARASRQQFSQAVGGPEGTVVHLQLERPDAGTVEATVTRGPYRFPDFEARVLPDGVGYLRLLSFSAFLQPPSGRPNVIQELDAALERFEAAGVTAWVMDLRDNTGGYTFTADELIGRFLPDVVAAINVDERGNRGEDLTGSRAFRRQLPMAVLINDGSASSSEVFASAMQEYDRAAVVGERSAGALAGALTFPLPDGAGLYVAVTEVRTGRLNALVDEVGVTPDVEVEDTRTAADYAAGRDPQLEAAIAAARGRPAAAPPPTRFSGQLTEAALRDQLARYLPTADEVPPAPLIAAPELLGDLPVSDPNRFASAAEDARALAGGVQARGWLGSYARYYGGPAGLSGPYLVAAIDLYATPAGAIAALNSNDFPRLQREAPVPVQLGDGTVAYIGRWLGAGGAILMWRSGRAVVTAVYSSIPGAESFEPAVALARLVDARLRQSPIPTGVPATLPAQGTR